MTLISPKPDDANWQRQIPANANKSAAADKVTEGKVKAVIDTIKQEQPSQQPSTLKDRPAKPVKDDHLIKMSHLFQSSAALKEMSNEGPLIPFEPNADNANDVYMTNFKSDVQKAGRENPNDVVFKPGSTAAIRGKICFGLTQLFEQFENVMVATKNGQASVISKEDYNISYAKVYNPDTKSLYLVPEDYLDEQIKLQNVTRSWFDEKISGRRGSEEFELTPVDDHPGYYHMKSSRKDSPDVYVMHITSTIPSRIHDRIESSEPWHMVTDREETTFLVPVNEILKISPKNIETESVDDDSMIDEESPEEIADEVVDNMELTSSSLIRQQLQSEKEEEAPADRFVTIEDTKFEVVISQDNSFKLFPAEDGVSSLDREEIENSYFLMKLNEEDVLVPKEFCFEVTDGDAIEVDGKSYGIDFNEEVEDTYVVLPHEEHPEESIDVFLPVEEDDLLHENVITHMHNRDLVTRNNQNYELIDTEGKIKVVGKNINGMVQLKIENTFKKPTGETKNLELLTVSKHREEFYNRIDMPSFIQAFIATVLLRPQDGKVIDLGESNVLFQALPDKLGNIDPQSSDCKLRPVIIDLDETMPPANDFTQDPEFVKEGEATNIHAVRNGLMGFPQAREPLIGKNTELAIDCLNTIVAKKTIVNDFLDLFTVEKNSKSFNQNHIDAYNAVVDSIEAFVEENIDESWSLEDLFFHVFPEYENQWNLLGDMEPQRKSMHIGKDDPEKVLKRSKS